jgi:hypothetical protein
MPIISRRAVWVLGLLVAWGPCAHADHTLPVRVRGLDNRAEALIDEGLWRSTTFQRIVADVAGSNLIVYVSRTPMEVTRSGALRFVGAGADGGRYLLVELNTELVDRLETATDRATGIATLAHELQHVLEVAAADHVQDAESFDAFFREIGSGHHPDVVDTEAAQLVGARVYFEMTGRRP